MPETFNMKYLSFDKACLLDLGRINNMNQFYVYLFFEDEKSAI